MNVRRRVIISGLVGIATTGVGVGLCFMGRWGPCGPGDTMAGIGALMSIYQLPLVSERIFGVSSPGVVWQLIFPVLVWSAIAYIMLAVAERLGNTWHRKAQPAASPNGGPAKPSGNPELTEGPPSVS